MLRSVKSANAIRTTPITSRLMCEEGEAAPRASPRLAEVVTAMIAMLAQEIGHFKPESAKASHGILSHLVNRAQERAGGSPQPTTSLPGESEQYPIAAMSRQQDEVHTLRLAEN